MPSVRDVAIVIGRFQLASFHSGHKKLLDLVAARHKRVLIFLGVPKWKGSAQDPLDYQTRAMMFKQYYPDFFVIPLVDCQTNEEWSANLDKKVREIFPLEEITLYGGRDGFISHYTGHFKAVELTQDHEVKATDIREEISALPEMNDEFRKGVIYSVLNTPSHPIMCVDGAVLRKGYVDHGIEVLLIQKPGENRWRFPGGKLEPTESLSHAVIREVREETGVEIGNPIFVTSNGIPDWRAKRVGLSISSALFAIPYLYGAAKGSDDAEHAKWFKLLDLGPIHMEECHIEFLKELQVWIKTHEKELFNANTLQTKSTA